MNDRTGAATIVAILTFLAGCGSDGPPRFVVSGEVTRGGLPAPKGEIYFEPDAARGASGPQGRAVIEQGKFTTSDGLGAIAGPVVVRIQVYDGVFHPESPRGAPLGLPYQTHLDLPAADSTQRFELPVGGAAKSSK